jgi:transposase
MATPAVLPADIWRRTPPEAQAYMRALETHVAALEGMLQALQEQLNQTSRNSSQPPSSDPPQNVRPCRPRSHRRRGGQPGHPGHPRPLVPVEDVHEVVVLKPAPCPHCQTPFVGDDPTPWRHQVMEIPPIRPTITE